MAMNPPQLGGQYVEHIVRVPKLKEKFHIMKFNASLKVDVSKWEHAEMTRENNLKEFKPDDDMPKFGAGSEFGRELKEEARRKKYGIITKRYNAADQPWILNVAMKDNKGSKGEKINKKYKGLREGGITENASYFIFVPAADGAFEAYPVSEWYNFSPMVTYKYLNSEEAEEEFSRRDKVLNYFSIMMKKRLKPNDESNLNEEREEGDKKKKKGKPKEKSSDLLITEDEEWAESSEEEEDDEDEAGKEESKGKKKDKPTKGGKKDSKKKKKHVSDDEAEEDSDDGDDEGREVDYMSDSSSSGSDAPEDKAKEQLKGVEDEPALRKLDQSDSEEEEEKKENKEEPNKLEKEDKKVVKKEGEVSSESSSDSSDSDDFDNDNSFQSAMFMQQSKRKKNGSGKKGSASNSENNSAASSRAATPTQASKEAKTTLKQAAKVLDNRTGAKRKMTPELTEPAKKPRIGPSGTSLVPQSSNSSNDITTITEENVRRYLQRKPMTTTELLQKFKAKRTGLTSDQMVTTLAQILKRINPEKHVIKGKMYLSMGKTE